MARIIKGVDVGRAVLITGTDTGVGKTYVACGLIRGFKRLGLRVFPYKPVETGCPEYPADGRLLRETAGLSVPDGDVVQYLFREPLAPAVAERIEGKSIDPFAIVSRIRELEGLYDVVVVEGAGGLLVPVTGRITYADLANMLGMPLVVVARARLGTINHTLLTLRVARSQGLRVLAVVVNGYEGRDTAERTNPEVIEDLGNCRVFVVPKGDPELPPELTEIARFICEGLGCNRSG